MLVGYLVSVCQVGLTCTDTVNEKRVLHHDVRCHVDSLPYVLIAVLANKFYAEQKKRKIIFSFSVLLIIFLFLRIICIIELNTHLL